LSVSDPWEKIEQQADSGPQIMRECPALTLCSELFGPFLIFKFFSFSVTAKTEKLNDHKAKMTGMLEQPLSKNDQKAGMTRKTRTTKMKAAPMYWRQGGTNSA
jgi:hypothetical protein